MTGKKLSRRDMLKASVVAVAGTILAGCAAPNQTNTAPEPAVVEEEEPVVEEPKAEEPTEVPAVEEPEVEEPVAEAPASDATGHVVVMHFLHEFTEDHVAQFTSEYPDITLEVVDATDQTRFYAMYAAGTPPDLFRVQAPSIPQLLARKLLFDLTPYFETSELLKPDDLMPANDYYKAESPLKVGTGKLYGMVKDFSPDCTIYAYKPIFEEAGLPVPDDTKSLTFDEIRDISEKVLKKEGDRILTFGYGYETGWTDRFWMVALDELGEKLYTDSYDKIVLTENEDARAIAQWYYDMAKDNLTFSALNPSPNGWFGNDFTAGVLALAQYGFWFSAMAESDTTRGNVMLLPAPNWAGKPKDPTVTATGMIMTADTQVPDAAWQVFEWYNGGQPSIDRAKSGWGVPGLKSQLDMIPQETEFQKQANKVLQAELELNDVPMQFNPFLGEAQVSAAYTKYQEQALNGEIDFDTMLMNIENEVNAAIQDGMSAITE